MIAERKRRRTKPPRHPLACLWYTKLDLAELFGVSERTVELWVSDGRLPRPIKRGAKWVRWPKAQIDELLHRWTQGGDV